MRHAGRSVSVILFVLAGLSMAHAGTYLLTYGCWSCHDDVTSATHATLAGSSALVLAVVALIVTLTARHPALASSARVVTSRIVVGEITASTILRLLERGSSPSRAFTDPTVILELALLLVIGVLLARVARVVERVVGVTRVGGSARRRGGETFLPRRSAASLSGPRATAFNATGFLRAPPLGA